MRRAAAAAALSALILAPGAAAAPECPARPAAGACYSGVTGPPGAVTLINLQRNAAQALPEASPPALALYAASRGACYAYTLTCAQLLASAAFGDAAGGLAVSERECPRAAAVTFYGGFNDGELCAQGLPALAAAQPGVRVCGADACNAPPAAALGGRSGAVAAAAPAAAVPVTGVLRFVSQAGAGCAPDAAPCDAAGYAFTTLPDARLLSLAPLLTAPDAAAAAAADNDVDNTTTTTAPANNNSPCVARTFLIASAPGATSASLTSAGATTGFTSVDGASGGTTLTLSANNECAVRFAASSRMLCAGADAAPCGAAGAAGAAAGGGDSSGGARARVGAFAAAAVAAVAVAAMYAA
jgi:hypothetical protein